MSQLQTFKNEIFKVTAKIENDQVLFDVEQVAKSLGITQEKNNKQYIRWERVNEYLPQSSPEVGKGDFIPESLVYKLAFKASNQIAEQFQDWLAIEVIPTIRKTGGYVNHGNEEQFIKNYFPSFSDEVKQAMVLDLRSQNNKLTNQIEQNKPKVLFADSVASASTSILIGELAKILRQNGIDTGEKRLFAWLRDNRYLIKRKGTDYNMPTQKSMERELFEIRETTVSHANGQISIKKTTKVTGKGQVYFVNKFIASEVCLKDVTHC
ncbi:phage antirepressor KilAC domain-containing protein [Bacillus atrophaeus]|uniref:phage antirepressor KilAC domain-containing protein n=1 Tax=Bacillus atrophaeus TaxID=1452 RepID=UPI002E1FAC7A|nr:phage antirepressor KilAC domain-containing protein [Bacillus atrophaeus]